MILSSLARPLVIEGRFFVDVDRGFRLFFLALAAVAAFTRRAWFHAAVAATVGALFLTYVVLLFTRLR